MSKNQSDEAFYLRKKKRPAGTALTGTAFLLKWTLHLTSVRLFQSCDTVPGRLPQCLDLFAYLDKRRSLGLRHFFDSLKALILREPHLIIYERIFRVRRAVLPSVLRTVTDADE